MKNVFRAIGIVIGVVAIVGAVSLGGFGIYKVMAPATEQVRREVFEQSHGL